MEYNPNIIQIYFVASNEDNVVRLQKATNDINGRAYNYATPTQRRDGKYIVWFYANFTSHIVVTEKDLEKMLPIGKNLTEAIRESK